MENQQFQISNYLSASQINLYLQNEKAYYNKYILGIAEDEDKLSYAIGKEFENYLFNQDYDLSKCYKGTEPQAKLEKKFKAMKEIIYAQELFIEPITDIDNHIVGNNFILQKEINVEINNLKIKGYIDYIDNNKIIDIKTYSNEYQFNQMIEKYKRQLLTYSLAYPEHRLLLVAVEVNEYPQVKVLEISQETKDRETPILLDLYAELQTKKENTFLFDVEPKKVEIEIL